MKIIFGLLGIALIIEALTLYYYYYRTLDNFLSHEEISMSMFLVSERAPRAFKIMAFTLLFYGLGSSAIGIMVGAGFDVTGVAFRYGPASLAVISLVGVIYFQREIVKITSRPSERGKR
ncbi:MAG: hypothetical protein ABEK01_05235 [Candidatus Nanohaloarchaea archaeon]